MNSHTIMCSLNETAGGRNNGVHFNNVIILGYSSCILDIQQDMESCWTLTEMTE